MKRIVQTAAALAALGGALGSSGCMNSDRPSLQSKYTDRVDPCTPERYNFAAREAALAPFEAHVTNGVILDQYVATGDFEPGQDVLTPGGRVKLDQLTRKRPADGHIYLQTARDLSGTYDPAKPGELSRAVGELNAKRTVAVTNYLTATTAARGIAFDVTVIDPAEQLMPAAGPANSIRGFPGRFASGINGITGNAPATAGGAASVANVNAGQNSSGVAPGGGPQGGNLGSGQGGAAPGGGTTPGGGGVR